MAVFKGLNLGGVTFAVKSNPLKCNYIAYAFKINALKCNNVTYAIKSNALKCNGPLRIFQKK